ncbi:unnamed protein product, partial [Ectocarpus sp. 12 AP-2014]
LPLPARCLLPLTDQQGAAGRPRAKSLYHVAYALDATHPFSPLLDSHTKHARTQASKQATSEKARAHLP